MGLEIERRFLVNSKKLPRLRKGKHQIQGYLDTDPEKPELEIRIRIEESRSASITIKYSQNHLVRQEYEFNIPLLDAANLLKLTNKKVTKIRHFLTIKGKRWILDFFQDKNFPLIVAEIELKDEKEIFTQPLWVGKEVTNNSSYTARSLASKPFQTWTKKDLKK